MSLYSGQQKSVDRLTGRVLSLHYLENKNQAEIAKMLQLSTTKVNRIIRQAREDGSVEIKLNIGNADLYRLEQKLSTLSALNEAVLSPTISEDPLINLKLVAETAANFFLEKLRDGDTVCISGGKAISELVDSINPARSFDVTIVPATGGVQGKHYTDVNHLAFRLAEKLGGKAMQLHAPLFADSVRDRDMLMSIRSCSDVLDKARDADIALLGLGSVELGNESFFDLRPLTDEEKTTMMTNACTAEVFAYLLNAQGESCFDELNNKLIGLTMPELCDIPVSIAIAAGYEKVKPISAVISRPIVKTLVTDEQTATSVISTLKE